LSDFGIRRTATRRTLASAEQLKSELEAIGCTDVKLENVSLEYRVTFTEPLRKSGVEERPQIYLTNEQIQRLAALSLDSLCGIQMESTTSADTDVTGTFVNIDEPGNLRFFVIKADGSWEDQT